MKFKTTVGDLNLINSQAIALSILSREIQFSIEDIQVEFILVDKEKSEANSNYKIKREDKKITFTCHIFPDKNTRFAVTKEPAKLAVINDRQIYFSFVFERVSPQPVYKITINFFEKINDDCDFSVDDGDDGDDNCE